MTRLKPAFIAIFLGLALFTQACATGTSATVHGGGPDIATAQARKYDGPKARLAVVKFIDKSAKAGSEIGSGLSDMLASALFNSNRFIMLDRESLNEVVNEQDFGAQGRLSDETSIMIGKMEGAQLLVFGAITAFEKDHMGVGGFLVGALTLGASLAIAMDSEGVPIGAATYKQSYIAMDIKIVDSATGRVVYAGSVKSRAENWGAGAVGLVGGLGSPSGIGLGGFAGTGVEKAILAGIRKAVTDIVKHTPQEYYREQDTMDTTPQGLMARVTPVPLLGAPPVTIIERESRIIDSDEAYKALLADLGLTQEGAASFDWSKTRLIAIFAGEKQEKGYVVKVVKAIHRRNSLEVYVREGRIAVGEEEEPGQSWPYDVVEIDKPEKKIEIIWD